MDRTLTVVSKPRVINMKKKITAHKLDNFKFEIASGYTIKISPTSENINISRANVTTEWSSDLHNERKYEH